MTKLRTNTFSSKTSKLMVATTLTLSLTIATSFDSAETVAISKDNTPGVNDIKERMEEDKLLQEYKIAQAKQAVLDKIAEQEEQERLERERIQKIKNDFIYLVNSKDITSIDLRTKSGLTGDEAEIILQGTGLDGLGHAFVNAELNHGVNAIYLMAHAALESSWGTSDIYKAKNNLFGFTAYDKSPGQSATYFNTPAECINHVAGYISTHYLSEGGQYNNGPTLDGMNVKYASDENWANEIGKIIKGFVRDVASINQ